MTQAGLAMSDKQPSVVSPEKLPFFMAFGWGMGTLAPAILLTATNILLLRYMTDFAGIGAAFAASLIAFSKIYDAFTDPLMGVISDRTKSKIGRRRPYLLVGGVMLSLSLLVLFNPPAISQGMMAWYMTFALFLFATAYTVFNVPYIAMPAEMTTGYHQRSYLMTFRVYAVAIANLVMAVAGPFLIANFGGGAQGHKVMSWIIAPIVLCSAFVAYWSTRNAPFVTTADLSKKPSVPLAEQVKMLVSNKPFFILLLIKLFQLMTLGAQAAFPFFFTQVLQVSDKYLATYFLALTAAMLAMQPVWLFMAKRLGKKTTYLIALILNVFVGLTWLFAGAGEPFMLVLLRGVLLGACGGGALLLGQAMLPDTQEYDALRSGMRREGLLSGLYTTMEKFAQAIGVAIIGAFLGAMGYISSVGGAVEQPESAILAIYICIGVVPSAVSVIAVLLLAFFYDLSEEKLKALRAQTTTT